MQADTHLLRSTKHINNPEFLKISHSPKTKKTSSYKEITKYVDYWAVAAKKTQKKRILDLLSKAMDEGEGT